MVLHCCSRSQTLTSALWDFETGDGAIVKELEARMEKRAHVNRSKVPVQPCRWRRHDEPGLVAEAAELRILHQHSAMSDPMDKGFNYAEAFKSLDLAAVKKDLQR